MITFVKQGIQRIKDTKKYAQQKNVPNWYANFIGGLAMMFIVSAILTLFSVIFMMVANPNKILLDIFGRIVILFPFIFTAGLMLSIGQYPIKAMILFSYYIQKGLMKLINKLDMYLWKKTGKDSLASNFIVKHKRIVQLIFYIPLVLSLIFNNIPKH